MSSFCISFDFCFCISFVFYNNFAFGVALSFDSNFSVVINHNFCSRVSIFNDSDINVRRNGDFFCWAHSKGTTSEQSCNGSACKKFRHRSFPSS